MYQLSFCDIILVIVLSCSKSTYSTFSVSYLDKNNVSVLCPALTANLEDYPMLPEMFRLMVVIVLLNRLPGNIDHIAVFKSFDRFRHLASGNTPAAVDVPDDVRPKWPCVLPRNIGACIYGCANGTTE